MDLPPVEEQFTADGTEFIATLEAIAAAADRAAEAVARLQALEKGITDALDGQAAAAAAAAAGMAEAAGADNEASRAAAEAAAAAGLAAEAERGQADAAQGAATAAFNLAKFNKVLGESYTVEAAAAAAAIGESNALRNAQETLAAAEAMLAEETERVTQATADMAGGDAMAAQMARSLAEADLVLAAAQHAAADAARSHAAAQVLVLAAERDTVAAGASVLGWLAAVKRDTIDAAAGIRIFGIGLTGLHWILAGSFELLAVLGPALIALAAGLAVAAQGAVNLASHMQAVYDATEATYPVFGKTTGDVLGLGHAFQTAQNQANPGVYEVLGAALNSLQGHMGMLANAGLQVVHMFDQFAAKVTLDMQGAMGNQIQGLISHMVQDLQEFGQILGNLGHALLNFASAMPGIAQVLLMIADAISKVILFASGFGTLITFGMALEEMYRWGGLALTLLVRLTGQMSAMESLGTGGFIFKFGAALTTLVRAGGLALIWAGQMVGRLAGLSGAFGSLGTGIAGAGARLASFAESVGPMGMAAIAAVAAAVGFLVYKLLTYKDATQQWIAASNAMVAKASDLQVLNVIGDQMAQTQARLAAAISKTGLASVDAAHASTALGYGIQGTGRAAQTGLNDIMALTQHEQQLAQTANTVRSNIAFLAGAFHTTSAAAQGLANAAGVNLQQAFYKGGQAALIALTQIVNLERGLGAMSAPAGTLGNDMNVLGIQSQLAASKVQQLNQAWDQWIATVTGGMQALSQFETALGTMGNDAAAASAGLTGSIGSIDRGVGGMTYTLKGFGPAAMQSWQQFTSAVQQGNTVLDQLRTGMAEGVVSNKTFTDSVRGIVGQMAPFTQGNAAAVAMLRQLAAEAGGPAGGSLRQLERWAGVTGNAARNMLGKGLEAATVAMSNMGKVAGNLSADLSSQVDSAIAKTIYSTSGLARAVATYSKDAQAAHPSQVRLHSDLQNIASAMQRATTEGGQFAHSYTQAQNAADKAASSVAKSTDSIVHQTSAAEKAQQTIIDHAEAMVRGASAASTLADHTTTLASNTANAAQKAQQAATNTQQQGARAQTAAGQIQQMAQQVLTAGGNSLTAAGKMVTLAYAEAKAGSEASSAAGQVQSLASAISALQSKTVTVTTNFVTTGSPGGHAAGTMSAAPGIAMVGERGPELMLFHGGEQVFSAPQTAAILSMARQGSPAPAASGPPEIHVHVQLDGQMDGAAVWQAMQTRTLQYNVRNGPAGTGAWAPAG